MEDIDASLSLIAPDGTRIPVRIENYDPRNGTGSIVRQTNVLMAPTVLSSAAVGRQRESRASRKSETQPTPNGSGQPLLFPNNAEGTEALTAAGPGYTASVQVDPSCVNLVQMNMLHNACIAEAWSCLRAPKANGAFEMITPKALPPSGYSDESYIVQFLEAHFKSSLAAARARSQQWASERSEAAEQRKHLAKDAAVFFKLGTAANKPSTADNSKQAQDAEAGRLARRSSRKRAREDGQVAPAPGAAADAESTTNTQPTAAAKQARRDDATVEVSATQIGLQAAAAGETTASGPALGAEMATAATAQAQPEEDATMRELPAVDPVALTPSGGEAPAAAPGAAREGDAPAVQEEAAAPGAAREGDAPAVQEEAAV